MTDVPDFDSMTPEEIVTWVQHNDLGALIRTMQPAPRGRVLDETVPMAQTAVRLPVDMLAQLNELAAGDYLEGRSGLIRLAISEFLERHR